MDELEKYRLRYVLYIAEMQIDEEKGFPPLLPMVKLNNRHE